MATHPMLNLRTSRKSSEIIKIISDLFVNSSQVMLWQNQNGKRVISYATISNIDIDKKQIIFSTKIKDHFQNFSKLFTIYMRGDEKNIIFKQGRCRLNANKLALPIPNEICVSELRHYSRQGIPSDVEMSVIFSKRVGFGGQKSFTAKVMNLSSHGICLEFIQSLGKFFYSGDQIQLDNFDRISFEPALEATIIYMQKPRLSADRIHMGLKFKAPLSQEQLDLIIKNHFDAHSLDLHQ